LKDRETLGSYNIKDAHTLHMVGNASSNQRSMAVATSAEKMAKKNLNEYLLQWTTLSGDEIQVG
jgi:Tfp pilus assembly protein PilP